jgi:mRNA interferase MazF
VKRGEIWLIDFEPTLGSESSRTRPAVIVSNDGANLGAARNLHGMVTVVPLTTNTERVYAFQALLDTAVTGLNYESKAQAEQVRAVSVQRLVRCLGAVSGSQMRDVDAALRLHLALD